MSRLGLVLAIFCTSLALAACTTTQPATTPSHSPAASGWGKRVEVTADSLNVRQLPSKDGVIIEKLKRGDQVTAPRQPSEGWLFIETDSGVSGYVSEKYVRPVSGDSAS